MRVLHCTGMAAPDSDNNCNSVEATPSRSALLYAINSPAWGYGASCCQARHQAGSCCMHCTALALLWLTAKPSAAVPHLHFAACCHTLWLHTLGQHGGAVPLAVKPDTRLYTVACSAMHCTGIAAADCRLDGNNAQAAHVAARCCTLWLHALGQHGDALPLVVRAVACTALLWHCCA